MIGSIFTSVASFLTFSLGLSGGVLLTTLIAVYFLFNPEKFQKWASMVGWAVSRVWKKAEYFAIKNEIQGEINSFVSSLETKVTARFPRVSVRWAAKDNEDIVWEDDEAIVVMRDRQHKKRNLVHAVYFFTSEALLRKSKKHLSKSQKTSLALFTTLKILQTQSSAAVEQFVNDYFSPYIEKSDDVRHLTQKYKIIDRLGIYFPILIQELSFLGGKVFLEKPTSQIMDEVKALIEFLERFAEREVGDTSVSDIFIGNYMRCTIKIVSSRAVRERGNIHPHKTRLLEAAKQGFENIYIIGNAQDGNEEYMQSVVDAVLEENSQIELVKTDHFAGHVKFTNGLRPVRTCFMHLRNPVAIKHLYTKNDF